MRYVYSGSLPCSRVEIHRLMKNPLCLAFENLCLGFMLHPSLVVDAVSCFPYGYSHVHIFNRELERESKESRDKHKYKKLDIEEKESNKWLLSSQAAKEIFKGSR